jgi:3D-(3,5/4)-trihydroxycyclohexane-1,2-dione acylhydrolase (decyclizing)
MHVMNKNKDLTQVPESTADRAQWLAKIGGLETAVNTGVFSSPVRMPLAEALLLGLMRQGVTKYLAVFGHGSTALAEMLRIYETHGLVRTWQFRNEVEMSHTATALRWIYDESCALVTSIGPGALQAMAGSLTAASNGIGVYHIYGDETTHGEGYNMQQVPKPEQGLFGQITALMGHSYTLHTPQAVREALRQGAASVFHPWKPGPFYMILPINTQPAEVRVRIDALPQKPVYAPQQPADDTSMPAAVELIRTAKKVAIKVGGGGRLFAGPITRFAEASGAAVVLSPGSTGVLPDSHPQNMHVGGSKGSISGNFAMSEADLLIAIGSRAVCQSDCSGIGWPQVTNVVNINADPIDVQHYNQTLALHGDIAACLNALLVALEPVQAEVLDNKVAWLAQCEAKKQEWVHFKQQQFSLPPIYDEVWRQEVLTQPQALKIICDFCKSIDALKLFDAGDVQANGFQIVEDDVPFETVTDSGASYMGFAVSALLSGAMADKARYAVAFSGDGSFMMNPQILLDGVQHGVDGTIVILDNRRMAAISHLQLAQYGKEYRTNDSVAVDYIKLASSVQGVLALPGGASQDELKTALRQAHAHKGLSLVHIPVYHGTHSSGGMGAYGQWNVGNWCDDVQRQYVRTRI